MKWQTESTYLCQKREQGRTHLAVGLVNILQAQRYVSCQNPSHDTTFYVDLAPCFGIQTIAVLRFACEQNKVAARHATSLTRQLKGNQIIQTGISREPTKDIHNIIDEDSSMTRTGGRNGPSAF